MATVHAGSWVDSIDANIERSIDPLAEEWDELADRAQAMPFVRPGWIGAWWRAFGSGTLEILTVRRDGRLVGVLPLAVRRGGVRSPTNWHTPEFELIAEDIEAVDGLAKALLSQGHRYIALAFLDEGKHDLERLSSAAAARRYWMLSRTIQRSPFMAIDRDWDTYQRGLSKNLRGDFGRQLRRLCERGRVSVEISDGRSRLDELLAEGFRIESSGWKASRRTAIVSAPETLQFYREVARWAADRGWLRLAFLRVNDAAVAFEFSLEHRGVHYFMKSGYDPTCPRIRPKARRVRISRDDGAVQASLQ
jgi:CelD/BcsL family acetyltransferase involved in cellulose biosynthesis